MNGVAFINLIFIIISYDYLISDNKYYLSNFENYFDSFIRHLLMYGVFASNFVFLLTFVRKLIGLKEIQGSHNSVFGVAGYILYKWNWGMLVIFGLLNWDIFYHGIKNSTDNQLYTMYGCLVYLITIINFHIAWRTNPQD